MARMDRGLSTYDADRLDARDPALIRSLLPVIHKVNRHYFQLRCESFETLASGPVLYVGNHNGGIAGPDLSCIMATLWQRFGVHAPLFGLAHDFAMQQVRPFGALLQRFGAIRARPDNALRALRSGAQVLVYPGGDLDAYRHSRLRNRVILGTRSGFVRVAQAAGVPIVPIVAHGAHRSAYIFSDGAALARRIRLKEWARLERFPLALALPWGLAPGPWLPYLPLPFPIRLRALPAIKVAPNARPDHVREEVQSVMQEALSDMAGRDGGAA